MMHKRIFKIVIAGAFITLGWMLPFVTGQIKEIGSMFLPMHLPIFVGGLMLGPLYGAIIGLIVPITRSLIFGMPNFFPTAVSMSLELATYGFISGLFFNIIFKNKRQNKGELIAFSLISIIIAMLIGRIVWGLSRMFFAMIPSQSAFPFSAFIAGAFINAWPGMVIQIIVIPLIILALNKQIINDSIQDTQLEEQNIDFIN